MSNRKLIILVGPPGSGKSTWAKSYLLKHPNTIRVNRDDFRLMLRNQNWCEPKIEELIVRIQDNAILEGLNSGCDVIIDNTNCKQSVIERFIKLANNIADIEFIVFDISLNKAIERDANREKSVGANVVKGIYETFAILKDTYAFQNLKKNINPEYIRPDFDNELPQAVIFDIDGTLALMKGRDPYDWDKVHRDDINEIVKEQIEFHRYNRAIILVSGREDVCRKDTEDWLKLHNVHYDILYMRSKGDSRKDSKVKEEIYLEHIKPYHNVICVYDDRKSVIKKWRELGLFTFDVNQLGHVF